MTGFFIDSNNNNINNERKMKTFEIETTAACLTTVKANSKEEAMLKFRGMTNAQKRRNTRVYVIDTQATPDYLDDFVREVEE